MSQGSMNDEEILIHSSRRLGFPHARSIPKRTLNAHQTHDIVRLNERSYCALKRTINERSQRAFKSTIDERSYM